jgi:hypothetical protein
MKGKGKGKGPLTKKQKMEIADRIGKKRHKEKMEIRTSISFKRWEILEYQKAAEATIQRLAEEIIRIEKLCAAKVSALQAEIETLQKK